MEVSGSLAEHGADNESDAPQERAARTRLIVGAVAVLTFSLLAATLLPMTASRWWLGDLAVHFPLQYVALALIAFLVFVGLRRPVLAALALGIALVNALSAAPVLATRPPPEPRLVAQTVEPPIRLRMVAINVLYRNREHAQVAEFLRRERPDVVALVEMNDRWRRALATVAKEYPYRYETKGSTGRGVSLWSRVPLRDAGILNVEAQREPAIRATLMVANRPLRLFAVHASWPMAPASAALRNRQLALLAREARATQAMPLVVIGDLNISPFSPHFQRLLKDSGLRSAAEGFGWQPTWPTYLPPAGIQIDHALITPTLRVRAFRRGPFTGSDHRPIVMDLAL